MTTSSDTYIRKLYDSFPFFVSEIFAATKLANKAPLGQPELDICQFIQDGPPQRGVLAPRGIGKTTLGTGPYTLWRIFRDPDDKIIVVSKSGGAAKKMVYMIRSWINTIPFLHHLKPKTQVKGSRVWRDNTDMFDAGPSKPSKDPSVLAIGIEGQLENCRAHVVIGDDVETASNTRTIDAREDLANRANEFSSVATFGDQEIILFGTYHHRESLYKKEADKGFLFRSWPILAPDEDQQILNLAPSIKLAMANGDMKPGDRVFPHRHSDDYIARCLARGKTYFAMQHMLLANLDDQLLYPLRLRDLILHPVLRDKAPLSIAWGLHDQYGKSTRAEDVDSVGLSGDWFHNPIMFDQQWATYSSTIMWVDPSGAGSDKTGYAIVSHLNSTLYAHDVGGLGDGGSGHAPAVLNRLAQLARQYGATQILVEDFGLQAMFAQLLEPVVQSHFLEPNQNDAFPDGWKASVSPCRVGAQQKEHRILSALEPVFQNHRLVVDHRVARNERLQHQISNITYQRDCLQHEDELEALAMAVAQFASILDIDPDVAAENKRAEAIDEQLRQQRELLGQTDKRTNWIDKVA